MNIYGSTLALPFRVDGRGTLATVGKSEEMIRQSILSIIQTRQGGTERPMMGDYGLPDFVFAVMDAGFAPRVAAHIKQQLRRYEPLVENIKVTVGSLASGACVSSVTTDPHVAAIKIQCNVRGSNVPLNLVFPVWELRRSS